MIRLPKWCTRSLVLLFFVLPASTTYELHDAGFGAGGVDVGNSSNYSISGTAGEVSSNSLSGTTYDLGPGLQFARQSNTPAAPTFTNPASHYNKLQFILDTGGNPSDAQFAIAISTDNFATTNYVQADNTIGVTPVYQTYATWGGGSGAYVIGLQTNTAYKMKVKAIHTKYTESAYSAEATASTIAPTLSYDIDIHSSDTETGAPYIISFGTLNIGSVTTSPQKIWVDLDTNAEAGAFVYLYANNTGLTSASAGYTIPSATVDLSGTGEGYGIRIDTTTQGSGALTAVSPYNTANDVVGILDTTSRTIFTSNNAPISAGRGSLLVKAKASTTTPAAGDYASVITIIASATF